MIRTSIILLLLFIPFLSYSQDYRWSHAFEGVESRCNHVASDMDDNVYVAGWFAEGSIDLDPGAGSHIISGTDVHNGYLAKYDSSGNLIWGHRVGAEVLKIKIASGYLHIAGIVWGTFDFDLGPGTTSINSGSGSNFFSRYSPEGALHWVKLLPPVSFDMDLDHAGNIYLAGTFRYCVDMDPGSGISQLCTTLMNEYERNIFIAKYNRYGELEWARHIASAAAGVPLANNDFLRIKDGRIFLTGSMYGSVDFDPGTNVSQVQSGGWANTYLACYNLAGALEWVRIFKSISGENKPYCATVDDEANTYVCGFFYKTIDFDGDGQAEMNAVDTFFCYIAKFNKSGIFQWAKRSAMVLYSGEVYAPIRDMEIDPAGNLYLAGCIDVPICYDPSGIDTLVPQSTDSNFYKRLDATLVKFDNNGNYQWGKIMGGTDGDFGNTLTFSPNSTYLFGLFRSDIMDLDLSNPTGDLVNPTPGTLKAYVARFHEKHNFNIPVDNVQMGGLYPNPFIDEAHLVIPAGTSTANAQFTLYNSLGALLHFESMTSNHFVIKRGSLAPGLYYYKVVQGNKVVCSGKLIAQ